MNKIDINKYMEYAYAEALLAGIQPLPNPSVGAIVVSDNGTIVGRGHTMEYGGEHAESVALTHAGARAHNSILFCTLEPCHGTWRGKHQEACTTKIVTSGIKEVYIACRDDNEKIQGRGIDFLRTKGIRVHVYEKFEAQCRVLNEVYEFLQSKSILNINKLPFVSVKIAESQDACMAKEHEDRRVIITGEATRQLIHAMRARHQAILTSSDTVNKDNPLFTVRDVDGLNPALCIIDSTLKLDPQSKIFDAQIERRMLKEYKSQIVIFTRYDIPELRMKQFQDLGACVIRMERGEEHDVERILKHLRQRQVYAVMVEAGPRLSAAVFNLGVCSKITLCISDKTLHHGIGIDRFLLPEAHTLISKLRKGTSCEYQSRVTQVDEHDRMIQVYPHRIF